MSDFVEKVLNEYYANVKPGIVDEITMAVENRMMTEPEFRGALLRYRREDAKGDFAPTLRRLDSYFSTGNKTDRYQNAMVVFWSMVEYYGWEPAVASAIRYGCGLGGKQSTALQELMNMNNITPGVMPYCEDVLLSPPDRWFADYLRILHMQRDPYKALCFAAQNAPDKFRGYYFNKRDRYEGLPIELQQRQWPYLRKLQEQAALELETANF